MKPKQIAILVIVLLAAGLGVAGLMQRLNRPRSPGEIIYRVDLALKNNKPQEAIAAASDYVKQNTGSWQGRYALGKALLHVGRMEAAIEQLDMARRMSSGKPAVMLLLAEAHAMPSRVEALPAEPAAQTAALEEIIAALTTANSILADIQTPDANLSLEVRMQMGLNLSRRAEAREFLSRLWLASPAGYADLGREMARASRDDYRQTVTILMDIIKRDPQRERAGLALLEACNMANDPLALDQASRAILLCKSPAPAPACMVIMQQLLMELPRLKPDQRKEVLDRAATALEQFSEDNPHNVHVLTARAQIAFQRGDIDAVDRLCQDIFLIEPANQRALLLQGEVLLARGQIADADAKLQKLSRRYPLSVEVLLAYARAARAAGKTAQARETLEHIVRDLDKNNPAARELLIEMANSPPTSQAASRSAAP